MTCYVKHRQLSAPLGILILLFMVLANDGCEVVMGPTDTSRPPYLVCSLRCDFISVFLTSLQAGEC